MLLGMILILFISITDYSISSSFNQISYPLFLFYFPFVFAIYPLIYFYLIKITNDENDRIIIKIFKFLPILVLIVNIFFYISYPTELIVKLINQNFLKLNSTLPEIYYYEIIIYFLYYIQLVIFLTVFSQLYFKHKKRMQNKTLENKVFLPKWLFGFIFSIYAYEIIYLLILFFGHMGDYQPYIEQIDYFLILIVIGFLGVKYDELVLEFELQKMHKKFAKLSGKVQNVFDKDYSEEVMKMLNEVISGEQLFKNAGLKLEHISRKVHIPVNTISGIINQSTKQNFSHYLNSYRIEAAKKIMTEESNKKVRMEDIFSEVGFYSRSTFNRAFKKIEGVTPTVFLNKYQASKL
jgi:AraC-like DNA-binding protein